MKAQSALNRFIKTLFFAVLFASASMHAAQYFQDFSNVADGATNFTDGSALFTTHPGTGTLVTDPALKELQMTDENVGGTRSAWMLPNLDSNAPIYAFSAKWNAEILGNFNSAADGFSLNYGALGAVNLIGTQYAQESGYSNGLSFCVQTFSGNDPGFHLRINGKKVASASFNPATQWGVNSGARHYFELDWHHLNGLTVRVDGQTIFTNVLTHGFIPNGGDRFVFAARTGGFAEEIRLDNVNVMTGGNLLRVPVGAPYLSNAGDVGVANAFDGVVNPAAAWQSFNPAYAQLGGRLPAAANIRAYALSSASAANSAPVNWALYGGNGAPGTLFDTVNGGRFFLGGETRCWPGTNTSSFTDYALVMGTSAGASFLALSELSFYQFVPVTNSNAWQDITPFAANWNGLAIAGDGTSVYAGAAAGGTTTIQVNRRSGGPGGWGAASVPNQPWNAVATSFDGRRVFAANAARVWSSGDFGTTWAQTPAPDDYYYDLACTPDGTKVVAAINFGGIRTSTNSGANWTDTTAPAGQWRSVAISDDGTKLIGGSIGFIFVSTNSGATWTAATPPSDTWLGVAVSGDGRRMIAAGNSAGVWVSTNSGANWFKTSLPDGPYRWHSAAASANGNLLLAGRSNGGINASTDGGLTWSATPAPDGDWRALKCSADGAIIIASDIVNDVLWRHGVLPRPAALGKWNLNSSVGTHWANFHPDLHTFGLASGAWLVWGATTNYGQTNAYSVPAHLDLGNVPSVSLTALNLTPGRTYHYRIFATNALSSTPDSTADATFTTPGTLPAVTTLGTSQDNEGSVVFGLQLAANDLPTVVWFEWGTNASLGNLTAPQNAGTPSGPQNFIDSVSGLTPGATFFVRGGAANEVGTNYGGVFILTLISSNTVVDLGDAAATTPSTAYDVIDNSAETALQFPSAYTNGVVIAVPYLRVVRAVSFISAADAPESDPASFIIEGSMDGVSYTFIASNAIPPFAARHSVQSIPFANETAYQFYRIKLPTTQTPGALNTQLAEGELLVYPEITSTNDTVSITLPEGAEDVNGADKLFNRQLDGSEKLEVAPIPAGSNTIVNVTLAAGARVLKGFQTIGAADDASYPERVPSSITVAGSNDGTNYTTLATRFPDTTVANLQLRDFGLNTNTLAFSKYRITFGAPLGGDRIQVGEMRLFGEVPAAPAPTLSVRASGGNLLVSWPNAAGFNLESKTNLSQLNWLAVTNTPVLSNGVNTVTIPMSGAPIRFFQLRK